jgi:hypothetical protein
MNWRQAVMLVRRRRFDRLCMMRCVPFHVVLLVLVAFGAKAAEKVFDFANTPEGKAPPGFRSTVTGAGEPGEWKIVLDAETPLLPPISPQATPVTKRPVLAQVSRDKTDNHFPLLVYEGETFRDFTLSTKFKIVDGTAEQMAGIAFRIQDEKNYYYVRASALGSSFYFFKFVNGELIGPIGAKVPIEKGVWHELKVECKGSQITCSLNGKALIPNMQQDNFVKGKVGFWTKSDSVSYFADTKIIYAPLEPPAEGIVRALLKKYPRLVGLKLYIRGTEADTTRLIAGSDPAERDQPGGKTEIAVISTGEVYYGKEDNVASVIMPVRDRNGDVIAAARIMLKSFAGQTEQNAISRATPIIRQIQSRVDSMDDLVE